MSGFYHIKLCEYRNIRIQSKFLASIPSSQNALGWQHHSWLFLDHGQSIDRLMGDLFGDCQCWQFLLWHLFLYRDHALGNVLDVLRARRIPWVSGEGAAGSICVATIEENHSISYVNYWVRICCVEFKPYLDSIVNSNSSTVFQVALRIWWAAWSSSRLAQVFYGFAHHCFKLKR